MPDDIAGPDPEHRRTRVYGVGLPARRAAVGILRPVLDGRQTFDEALKRSPGAMSMLSLVERDRALARMIATVTLRRRGEIEAVLRGFLDTGIPRASGPLHAILLSGVAQLLFMDTAPHAAIDLSVRLAQGDASSRRYDKLVNAVLRRVDREGAAALADIDGPRANTPDWLWDRWIRHYGAQVAREIAEANLVEPPLDISVKSDASGWAEKLGGVVLPTGTVRLAARGRIDALPGFDDGEWWVQDAAAALPARLLGRVEGERVADLCAAPGGKTAQLAAAGAIVTAVDLSLARLALVEENLVRLRLNAQTIAADAAEWTPEALFNAVLLDAPCSATGTIRRHPDVPWLRSQADISRLALLQSRLLDKAIDSLKPGGVLVYATCSLEPEEGVMQIERVLDARDDIALDPISAAEINGSAEWIAAPGYLRTLPCQMELEAPTISGMDGFFAARLTKTE
jgi:16S rRNA (cytosine967-C5)-methyltransferase